MVQITVDTKNDTEEEIRNTIRYLQSVVGDDAPTNFNASAVTDIPTEEPVPQTPGSFSMFDTNTFSSDDEAPSDYVPEKKEEASEDDTYVEIVEY